MKLLASPVHSPPAQRGAALMLSFMVLMVLILILMQIRYSTDTTARVSRNEETLVAMDSAIESALLQVFEDLKSDAESDSAAGADAGGDAAGALGGSSAGADAGAEEESGPTDSKEDEWARPQRTEVNEIQLRILIQDEDSKFNVLSVLTPDEEEADKALDRLARVIEWSRKGTKAEIDGTSARRMAETITAYMQRRADQILPRPQLLSDREENEDVGLPLSLREFAALDPELFPANLFRDFIDEDEKIVHSLGTFLTVWSSVTTVEEANELAQQDSGETAAQDTPGGDQDGDGTGQGGQNDQNGQGQNGLDDAGQGNGQDGAGNGTGDAQQDGQNGGQGAGGTDAPPGWAINVNTAPGAVLHALLDSRDTPYRFWDDVVQYRNDKDEEVEENDDPPLDEYGRPILVKQYFHSVDDLAKVDGWENLEPIVQGELRSLLKVESQVFSIWVTARKPTGDEQIDPFSRQEDIEREEANWQGLVRTVRVVVWRRSLGEGEIEIVPLVRWEVADDVPFEVLDFPESRDYR
jgi:hypothetical protein